MPHGRCRRAHGALLIVISCLSLSVTAAPKPVVTVGVLAKRGTSIARERWQATVEYLSNELADFQFELVPLSFEEIEEAVVEKRIHFLLTNPGIYVEMSHRHGITRIATLKRSLMNRPYTEFGGVVFRRAGNGEPRGLDQLHGESVAAVARTSLGGWIVAWREFLDEDIDPEKDFAETRFLGTHDAVVDAVLAGKFYAGVVRTDTLEHMAAEGKISLRDVETLTSRYTRESANPQDVAFPVLVSTRLYPEWPFSKLAHVPDRLAERTAVALVAMPETHTAAQQAQIKGWTVAKNYRSVDDAFNLLGIGPYAKEQGFTARDVIRRYWLQSVLTLAGALAIAGALLYVIGLNRKLRASEAQLRDLAMHDGLTKLPNRVLFMEAAGRALANACRHNSLLGVLFIDLDNFKPVNDSFGHAVGDLILQDVSERLQQAIRKGDIAARIGGDEFVILLDSIRNRQGVERVMARIIGSVSEEYYVHGVQVSIGCSVGAALFPKDGPELEELMHNADLALYAAKTQGKGRSRFFDGLPDAVERGTEG